MTDCRALEAPRPHDHGDRAHNYLPSRPNRPQPDEIRMDKDWLNSHLPQHVRSRLEGVWGCSVQRGISGLEQRTHRVVVLM